MLKTSSISIVLQLLIDAAGNNEFDESKDDSNETNLSNSSASKKSTRAGYLTPKNDKKGNNNTKKGVKAVKGSDYLILSTKKP